MTTRYLKECSKDRRLCVEIFPSQFFVCAFLVALRDIESDCSNPILDIEVYNAIKKEFFIYEEETIVKIGERISQLVDSVKTGGKTGKKE